MASKKKKILKLNPEQRYEVTQSEEPEVIKQIKVFSIGLASEIGFSIAVPLVVGALFGVWLDQQFGTRPKLTLSFLFVGILLSGMSFGKIISNYIKKNK